MAEERGAIQIKKKRIKELEDFVKDKKVIGLISLQDLPSAQFQEIKKKLRSTAQINVYSNLVINKVFEKDDKLKPLLEKLEGPSGVIISDENPFKIFRFLKENQSEVYAKAGQTAPKDIIVEAGETDMPAGPALAELKVAKIDVKIANGKIVIKSDSTVVKEGEVISDFAANALSKLDIKPLKIGIKLNALLEDNTVYTSDVLDIDMDAFMQDLNTKIAYATNLAVNISYYTPQSIQIILSQAVTYAQNLALNAEITNKFTIEKLLAKAQLQAKTLSN